MKKVLIWIGILFLGLIFLGFMAMVFKTPLISKIISVHSRLPVSIEQINFSKEGVKIANFKIRNLPKAELHPAFQANRIDIYTTLKQLREKTRTIDKIDIANILINVERFVDNTNNWQVIMSEKKATEEKKPGRPFLIKELILTDIDIVVKDASGIIKNLPRIKKLTFTNLSSEEGYGADEIERAVLYALLKKTFIKAGLNNILENLNPANLVPNLLNKIPFVGEGENAIEEAPQP